MASVAVGGVRNTHSMLTDTQARILEFERRWLGRDGAKDAAIRAEFGWFAATYYRRLGALVRLRDAVEADPITVRLVTERMDRLQTLRAHRRVA